MVTIEQIRAARAMLNISQKQLAKKAGVAIATLNNIERGAQTDPKLSTVTAIQQSLEKEGIMFTSDPLGGVGISLKPRRSATHNNATILIVDDSRADRTLYKNWLSAAPGKKYRLVEAENARAGFDAFIEHAPQCLVLDFMMYGADGFQLLAALRREHVKLPPIVFVTGMHNEILEESAHAQGVYCYLNKQTLSPSQLCKAIDEALKSKG